MGSASFRQTVENWEGICQGGGSTRVCAWDKAGTCVLGQRAWRPLSYWHWTLLAGINSVVCIVVNVPWCSGRSMQPGEMPLGPLPICCGGVWAIVNLLLCCYSRLLLKEAQQDMCRCAGNSGGSQDCHKKLSRLGAKKASKINLETLFQMLFNLSSVILLIFRKIKAHHFGILL